MDNSTSKPGDDVANNAAGAVQRGVDSAGSALHSTIDKMADPARNTVDRVSTAAHNTVDKLASGRFHPGPPDRALNPTLPMPARRGQAARQDGCVEPPKGGFLSPLKWRFLAQPAGARRWRCTLLSIFSLLYLWPPAFLP